ncbi:semaphorin-4G [Tachyglossus aculeatus]|uniref:semaphorin-4G n=1 Tax=Tachyglossus aculeatus TaxID=9261 RepID=UPI0018F3FE92|nr:semaphorin-4G [Tachyglossus aculeatus]XP_038613678.1 semaphorin-4G [Tachyglossus aculeatus]
MPGSLGSLLLGFLIATAASLTPRRSAVDLDVTPRMTVPHEELTGTRLFGGGTLNYSTLLLEEAAGLLLVGARGALFSLNSSDIADGAHREIRWEASAETQKDCLKKGKNNQTECFNHIRFLQRLNGTHLYVCGTHAFHPLCAVIDADKFTLPSSFEEGKEKCPYDPARGYTGLIVDGGLYTATRYEFRSLPDIRRSLHPRALKTEESPMHWLNDAEFVASVLVRESQGSSVGDDDKLYYFFTERAAEESGGIFDRSRAARVARVARICKGDLGGKKILQKKWTSFLKARLVCHVPFYEALQSVCSLDGGAWRSTLFYATFTLSTQWRSVEASAVCRYNLTEVQAAFAGPYMEYQDSSRKWGRYDGKVPEPRPGSCITDGLRRRGFNSSQDLPNSVLDFVKLHPLMAQEVGPAGGRPLLLKRNVLYTQLAVARVDALDGWPYDLLFMGTGDGWIHKAVVLGSGVHIIEEIQAFPEPQPVEGLVISLAQHSLYVGAPSGVLQLPLSSCFRYDSCYACVLARDPYCAWDGQRCRHVANVTDRAGLTQDVERGNRGCVSAKMAPLWPPPKNRTVVRGDDVLLACDQPSNLAWALWQLNGSRTLADGQEGYRVGVDGLLVTDSRPEQSGLYRCYAQENGLRTPLAAYALTVRPEPPGRRPLPKEPAPAPVSPGRVTADVKLAYILAIAALGALCLVLGTVLLHVACRSRRRRGKFRPVLGQARAWAGGHLPVELHTVSGQSPGPDGDGAGAGGELGPDHPAARLQIIPGEAPAPSPARQPSPPPPPPPPPPSELPNGLGALPSMLRKMNGNSYVLLRQSEDGPPPHFSSLTEELNRFLEKRKHTQLVDKLDESSV